jgi:hypothetical protein
MGAWWGGLEAAAGRDDVAGGGSLSLSLARSLARSLSLSLSLALLLSLSLSLPPLIHLSLSLSPSLSLSFSLSLSPSLFSFSFFFNPPPGGLKEHMHPLCVPMRALQGSVPLQALRLSVHTHACTHRHSRRMDPSTHARPRARTFPPPGGGGCATRVNVRACGRGACKHAHIGAAGVVLGVGARLCNEAAELHAHTCARESLL